MRDGASLTNFLQMWADPLPAMGKLISATITALVALVLMDQQLNYSRYTDAMLAILWQMKHSFG